MSGCDEAGYARADSIFVFEIDGVPIVAFPARNRKEAAGLQYQEWFKHELKSRKLWDGKPRRLVARIASDEQIARFNAEAIEDGDDMPMVYLVGA